MNKEQGNLSINSDNIFPIIKKWLYSDHDIFMRELISNGCDAITKLKKLELVGEASLPENNEFSIRVIVNSEDKTIKFIDNGIGMTADEVKQYINQIAFSGAATFLEKYKDKTSEDQIIGHFGLGFYSAFMVSHKVTIDTLSWQEGSEAVRWESDGGTTFEMSTGDRTERGSEITLHLNEDSYEFSNEYRAKEVIEKYCAFMPIPIYFKNANAPEETAAQEETEEETDNEENIIDADVNEDGTASETAPKKESKGPKPLNDTTPLWAKHPNDCTEEQYKEFYRKVFRDYKEPLFWIHLNMDYPFRLKGILYFPKINTEYENMEGMIKLYSNQVFIADNIKEVIPEFLLLLKGTIDCPDLPLNVSRSALQNDGFVKKISDYITKKVADKLSGMYKVEREDYEKYWTDISPFIKYGCLKDEKFREKMKEFMIFKDLNDKFVTLDEYLEGMKPAEDKTESVDGEASADESKAEDAKSADASDAMPEDANEDEKSEDAKEDKKQVVYYVTDLVQQSQYVKMFREEGLNALVLTHNIDQPFITQLEQMNDKVRFQRIDADLTDHFKEEIREEDAKDLQDKAVKLTDLFKKALSKEKLEVRLERLKNEKVSSVITLSEESRRMQDMMKMYNMGGMDKDMFGSSETLVLNANNTLVEYILEHENGKYVDMICEQLYDLAMISHKPLTADAMTRFIERSNEIMTHLTK